MTDQIFIGCAGWAIPKIHSSSFPQEGSHLERYAAVFNFVEINSSFYKPHRRSTYERWAKLVPSHFRFSAKVPRIISHQKKLEHCEGEIVRFLEEVSGLGEKLGPLLLQLPPKATFVHAIMRRFMISFRQSYKGTVVIEPRHPSWFCDEANSLLEDFTIGRVDADPPQGDENGFPFPRSSTAYLRLHGSPRTYYSTYDDQTLRYFSKKLNEASLSQKQVWCCFDNTAESHATLNALTMIDLQVEH